MTKRRQTIRTKSARQGKQARSGTVQRVSPKITPGDLMGFRNNGTGEAQAAQLNDLPLQTAQRQALAAEIGRVQGNYYLQRFVKGEVATDWAVPQQTDVYTPETVPFKVGGGVAADTPGSVGQIYEAYEVDATFGVFSDDERISFVRTILDSGLRMYTEKKRDMLVSLWDSFGERGLEVASANFELWKRSWSATRRLEYLKCVVDAKAMYERDVKETARGFLARNKGLILQELGQIGLTEEGATMAGTGDMSDVASEQSIKLFQIQQTAQRILKAQQVIAELKRVPVGYEWGVENAMDYYGDFTMGGSTPKYETPKQIKVPVKFDPAKQPLMPPTGQEEPAMSAWGDVKAVHDDLSARIAEFTNRHPAIYAAISEGKLEDLTQGGPQQTKAVIGKVLQGILENIQKTSPKLDGGDFWLELKPIHDQLLKGSKIGPSSTPWSQQAYQWVAKDLIEDYEDAEFWKDLGLSTLAAAAFLVAELATAGSATFFLAAGVGVGATGYQVYSSWEKYFDLAQAADTEVSEDLQIVYDYQAEAALLGAILDTAFGFLDVAGPIKHGLKAARAGLDPKLAMQGAKKAALEELDDIASMEAKEAGEIVERSINELGVGETARRMGLKDNPQELLTYTKPGSEAAERIRAYGKAADLSKKDVKAIRSMLKGAKALDGQQMDEVIAWAIDELGPAEVLKQLDMDWNKLAAKLGEGSKSGQLLLKWRDDVLAPEVKALFAKGEDGMEAAIRTGTVGNFSNDFDWNFLGVDAAANRDQAISYLMGRTGMSRKEMEKYLAADFFTDPRRIILYEKFPPDLRQEVARLQAVKEEQIVLNMELTKARKAKDKVLEQRIRDQMERAGIPEIEGGVKTLSKEDIRVLEKEIDSLHAKFAKAKSQAEKKKLAIQIADRQAYINAANEGAYVTGGAVRQYAIAREKELAGWLEKDADGAYWYTAAVGQMPHLQKGINGFEKAVEAGDFAKAMRSIGKYGERMTDMANKGLGSASLSVDTFETLEFQFALLYAQAKAKGNSSLALKKLLKDEFEVVTTRTKLAVDTLERSSEQVLDTLRKEAGLAGIEASFEPVQQYLRLHIKLIKAKEALYWQLTTTAKALSKGELPEVWNQSDAANQGVEGKKQTTVKE